jgi:molecular chaperone GrpE
MEETTKVRLLEEFRSYLDTLDAGGDASAGNSTDLFSLFSALEALRTEVKTESRLVGGAVEQFREVLELLRNSQANLDRELDRTRGELSGLRRSVLRPVLLELLDLYDRLAAGQAALQNYRPIRGWFRRIKSRPEDRQFIQSIRDGQAMTLRRLEETLARQQVHPLDVLGRSVDPHTMTVVELDHQPALENGVVTQELRKGFLWGEDVLRLAEVKANKL